MGVGLALGPAPTPRALAAQAAEKGGTRSRPILFRLEHPELDGIACA